MLYEPDLKRSMQVELGDSSFTKGKAQNQSRLKEVFTGSGSFGFDPPKLELRLIKMSRCYS